MMVSNISVKVKTVELCTLDRSVDGFASDRKTEHVGAGRWVDGASNFLNLHIKPVRHYYYSHLKMMKHDLYKMVKSIFT